MASTSKNYFEQLNALNVNEHTEKKTTGNTTLTYLSWAWAWAEVKKKHPETVYEIIKFDGLPYVFDPKTGYMVYTAVTIEGVRHEMWLPVMDSNNRAMFDHPYKVQTKYKTFTVQAATMFDINKTIMRCLTKNLAMHGLGLYIYAGEDIPEDRGDVAPETPTEKKQEKTPKKTTKSTQAHTRPESVLEQFAEPYAEDVTPKDHPDRVALREFFATGVLTADEMAEVKAKCKIGPVATPEDYQTALAFAKLYAGQR